MRGSHLGRAALLAALLLGITPAVAGAGPNDGVPRSFDRNSSELDAPTPAAREFDRRLGPEGRISISATTRTPRHLSRTDRPLTGPDRRAAARIVFDYLRRHREVFRLSERELEALGSPRVVVSPNGTRHLTWRQSLDGLPVAGADLRAHVAADGRILAVGGGPLATDSDVATERNLAAGEALQRARASVGFTGQLRPKRVGAVGKPARNPRGSASRPVGTRFEDGSSARLVVAATPRGPRLAWSVINADQGPAGAQAALVDADDGALLARQQLTRGISGQAWAWDARPSDPRTLVSFPDGWSTTDSALRGDFAYVYADVLGEGGPTVDGNGAGGEVEANASGAGGVPLWDEEYQPITTSFDPVDAPLGGLGCSPLYPCSWSSFQPRSWAHNLRQATLQAFIFINRFHDHLAAAPIGFDAASGNFETTTPGGTDGDPIHAVTFVGAAQNGGVPSRTYRNNARMTVLPDDDPDFPSSMQLYLFGVAPDAFEVIDGNSAEQAMVVYHEYAHGLIGRLVTNANGVSAMGILQAGALNEGVSDFYALDYLEATGGIKDDPDLPGEILAAGELSGGKLGIRESAVDCPVGVPGPELCPDHGGFSYADFANIFHNEDGEPEFEYHADGEIFTQTLWDLRTELIAAHGRAEGIRRARGLVTEGLRMVPAERDFLELRDSILLADVAAGSPDRDLIWRVFSARGMGIDAESSGGRDAHPMPGFDVPEPSTVDPPPNVDRSRPRLHVAMPRRSVRMRSRKGLPLRVTADRAVRLTATLTVPAGEARRRGLARKARRVRLAGIKARRITAGRSVVRLRVRAEVRRKLARVRQLRVKMAARVVDGNGRRSARTLESRLRR